MKQAQKNNNAITINVNDDVKRQIEILSNYYQRKPAEFLRLLLMPCIVDQYAKLQATIHPENKKSMVEAVFNG